MIAIKEFSQKIIEQLPQIGIGIFVFIIFILFALLVKGIISKRVKPKTKNPLLADFIGKVVGFIVITTGFVFFLNMVGLGGIARNIMAGAGITTFIIGFAFKDIGENFLSGILMAFKSPFSIGDLIESNGTIGYVNELNLRETIIKTPDGKDVFIPNSQIIKSPLFNYTIDGFLRYQIVIGIDYNTDFNKVIKMVKLTLMQFPEVLQGDKSPVVVVDELLVSSVNMRVYYWIDTFKSKSRAYHLNLKSQITIKILDELSRAEIYLPADILELKNYKNETIIKNE